MNLKDVMRTTPQLVYVLQAADRDVLVSSVTCLSVDPDVLMVSIMETERNKTIITKEHQPFKLLALGPSARTKVLKKDLRNFDFSEYVWKASGLTRVLGSYCSHTILALEGLVFEEGTESLQMIWINGGPSWWNTK